MKYDWLPQHSKDFGPPNHLPKIRATEKKKKKEKAFPASGGILLMPSARTGYIIYEAYHKMNTLGLLLQIIKFSRVGEVA